MRFERSIHAVSLRERIVFISDLLRFFLSVPRLVKKI